jgi:hypothetical protein
VAEAALAGRRERRFILVLLRVDERRRVDGEARDVGAECIAGYGRVGIATR